MNNKTLIKLAGNGAGVIPAHEYQQAKNDWPASAIADLLRLIEKTE